MKIILATLLSSAALAVLAVAGFIYSGVFNVAATEPHWGVTTWVLETARKRSIQAHAAGLVTPAGYDEPAKLAGAVGHFSEHCAVCHGGPGTKPGIIADGMYPQPPNLTNVASRYSQGELFWILKNGIKMSAMPSMASDGDDMLWATVAFLEKLPTMSDEDYNDLWMQSQAEGAHGGMDHGKMNMEGMDHGSMPMHGTPAQPGASQAPQGTGADATPVQPANR